MGEGKRGEKKDNFFGRWAVQKGKDRKGEAKVNGFREEKKSWRLQMIGLKGE